MICISLGLKTQICKFKIQFLPLYFQVKYLIESQQLGMAVGVLVSNMEQLMSLKELQMLFAYN